MANPFQYLVDQLRAENAEAFRSVGVLQGQLLERVAALEELIKVREEWHRARYGGLEDRIAELGMLVHRR